MLGLGHAILTGKRIVGDEPFEVILADDLCLTSEGEQGVMGQMAALYEQYGCSIVAIEEVPADQVHRYGVMPATQCARSDEGHRYGGETRARACASNLAIIGRILTPDILIFSGKSGGP